MNGYGLLQERMGMPCAAPLCSTTENTITAFALWQMPRMLEISRRSGTNCLRLSVWKVMKAKIAQKMAHGFRGPFFH